MFVLAGPVDALTRRVLERLDALGHNVGVLGHTAARLAADKVPFALDMPIHRPRDVERHLANATGVILRPGDPPLPPSRLVADIPAFAAVVVASAVGASAASSDAWLRDAGLLERIAARHAGHAIVRSHLTHDDARRIVSMQAVPSVPDLTIGFVDINDVASVIVARLLRGEQRHVMATGSRLWTLEELAELAHRDVAPVEDDLLAQMFEAGGFTSRGASSIAARILAHRGLKTTRAVQAATGQPPHALEVQLRRETAAIRLLDEQV